MSLLAGLSDCELKRVVQRLRGGGSTTVYSDEEDLIVEVKAIEPECIIPDEHLCG